MRIKKTMELLLVIGLVFSLMSCEKKSGYTGKTVHSNTGSTESMENTFHAQHSITINNIPENTNVIRMWLPVPKNDQNQQIRNLSIDDSPATVTIFGEPIHGNTFAYCEINQPTKDSYTMSYSFEITRKQQTFNTPLAKISPITEKHQKKWQQFLGSDTYIIIDDQVREKADEICGTENNPLLQGKMVYDWVIQHGEYWKKDKDKYKPSGHGSTLYFFEECTGNCTDFHAGFISLMRARGIPSRFNVGSVFWVDKDDSDEDLGYHCWPEFYAPGHGWVVADASQGDFEPEKEEFYFGNIETRRIVFTQGRDINLAPKQNGKPLDYFAKSYAEIDGKTCDENNMERKLTYTLVR